MAIEFLLSSEPLAPAHAGFDPDCGAVAEFRGVVRGEERGRKIAGIEYEAFREMALHQIGKIANEAGARFGCRHLRLEHRIGFVPAGESSLFLRIMAPHRREAFQACEWVIDRLKEAAPIWKRPIFAPAPPSASLETVEAKAS